MLGVSKMAEKYYAHSLPVRPQEEWQLLEEHLKNVAGMARGLADNFGAGEWGYDSKYKKLWEGGVIL